jgi:hypothetical protein
LLDRSKDVFKQIIEELERMVSEVAARILEVAGMKGLSAESIEPALEPTVIWLLEDGAATLEFRCGPFLPGMEITAYFDEELCLEDVELAPQE